MEAQLCPEASLSGTPTRLFSGVSRDRSEDDRQVWENQRGRM